MATLKELHELMVRSGISSDTVTMIITEMRATFPGEKIYVPSHDTSKKEQIIEAAKRLPAGIVAARLGVSHSWVLRATKKIKN